MDSPLQTLLATGLGEPLARGVLDALRDGGWHLVASEWHGLESMESETMEIGLHVCVDDVDHVETVKVTRYELVNSTTHPEPLLRGRATLMRALLAIQVLEQLAPLPVSTAHWLAALHDDVVEGEIAEQRVLEGGQ